VRSVATWTTPRSSSRTARTPTEDRRRYSPAKCIGVERNAIIGDPDLAHVSTSYVERSNLTMRMNMRRFTRLTNAFSRKIENHAAAVSLHFMAYNFAGPHKSLKNPTLEPLPWRRAWTTTSGRFGRLRHCSTDLGVQLPAPSQVDGHQRDADRYHRDPQSRRADVCDEHGRSEEHDRDIEPDEEPH
jgi:hypothetical protein